MELRYLLFDLDGTIIDSRRGIFKSFAYALSAMGEPVPPERELFPCIGPPLDYSFRNFFRFDEEKTAAAVKKYRERYSVKGVLEFSLIEGAKETLRSLSGAGFFMMLATSKPEDMALKILKSAGIDGYFSVICGSDYEVRLKNKTDVINEALSRAEKACGRAVDKEAAAIIGDRSYDIAGGKNAGIHTVGLDVGFAEAGELEESGADIVFKNFSELETYLLSHLRA